MVGALTGKGSSSVGLTGREGKVISSDKSKITLPAASSLRAARLCGLRARTLWRTRFVVWSCEAGCAIICIAAASWEASLARLLRAAICLCRGAGRRSSTKREDTASPTPPQEAVRANLLQDGDPPQGVVQE
jgi:hypothetical protein